MLTLAAIVVALRIVLGGVRIPLGDNLNIFFGYLINSLGSAIYGPVVALLSGFATDILGYFVRPDGPFFPGYVLSTMLGSFFYALFFYRARITLPRIIGAKLTVNLLVNVGLGALWIANTCFAYHDLMEFIGEKGQLVGAVALGYADEKPPARPRKELSEVLEYR